MRDLFITKGDSIFCFDIYMKNGAGLSLCSNEDNNITSGELAYRPYSGLSILEASFNDSGDSLMIIHGVFEEKGITKIMDLAGSTVKVSVYNDAKLQHFVTLYCKTFTKNDLDFNLELVSEIEKYKQPLLKAYSKTCRANFGDALCKIDKRKYELVCAVESISANTIVCDIIDTTPGYFSGGCAIIKDEAGRNRNYNIISQLDRSLELSSVIDQACVNAHEVILVPGCDKNLITCCKKYNNAVNFRGEPFIDDVNI